MTDNGKKKKDTVFELSEHIKLFIIMNFRSKKIRNKKKKNKNNTVEIPSSNRNIVKTKAKSIPL